jgi:hypothetical protein
VVASWRLIPWAVAKEMSPSELRKSPIEEGEARILAVPEAQGFETLLVGFREVELSLTYDDPHGKDFGTLRAAGRRVDRAGLS